MDEAVIFQMIIVVLVDEADIMVMPDTTTMAHRRVTVGAMMVVTVVHHISKKRYKKRYARNLQEVRHIGTVFLMEICSPKMENSPLGDKTKFRL